MGAITTIGGGLLPAVQNLYPPPATIAENLPADVTLVINSFTTIQTTQVLTPGVWLVTVQLTVVPTVSTNSLQAFAQIIAGTATATFAGVTSGNSQMSSMTSAVSADLGFTAIATVTAAGTLVIQGEALNAQVAVKATTVAGAAAKASGYVAVQVA